MAQGARRVMVWAAMTTRMPWQDTEPSWACRSPDGCGCDPVATGTCPGMAAELDEDQ